METIYDPKTYVSLDFFGLKVGPELQKHSTDETAVLLWTRMIGPAKTQSIIILMLMKTVS